MRLVRSSRWILLALLLSLIPASSFAGVFISVGFAPPVLPVYEQPPCPEPGWLWAPGYWAYGDDGYYWVPGSWVPAPYEGALWTPPYWGWSGGLYIFHPGYWGRHVGYYGGVNYGFGYMGIGFVGGEWHGRDFRYNTAVMHVNRERIRNVYEDRTIVSRYTVVNDRHVAYSGALAVYDMIPDPKSEMPCTSSTWPRPRSNSSIFKLRDRIVRSM
jgi:WXXGXW repeat (2 copies)